MTRAASSIDLGATVVSGCDTPPILEPAKHVLDFMTLLVELAVMRYWDLSVRPRWNAGLDFALNVMCFCVVKTLARQAQPEEIAK